MAVDGVGRTVNTIKGEIYIYRFAGLRNSAMDAPNSCFGSELANEIGGTVNAISGDFSVQQKRPPNQINIDMRS